MEVDRRKFIQICGLTLGSINNPLLSNAGNAVLGFTATKSLAGTASFISVEHFALQYAVQATYGKVYEALGIGYIDERNGVNVCNLRFDKDEDCIFLKVLPEIISAPYCHNDINSQFNDLIERALAANREAETNIQVGAKDYLEFHRKFEGQLAEEIIQTHYCFDYVETKLPNLGNDSRIATITGNLVCKLKTLRNSFKSMSPDTKSKIANAFRNDTVESNVACVRDAINKEIEYLDLPFLKRYPHWLIISAKDQYAFMERDFSRKKQLQRSLEELEW